MALRHAFCFWKGKRRRREDQRAMEACAGAAGRGTRRSRTQGRNGAAQNNGVAVRVVPVFLPVAGAAQTYTGQSAPVRRDARGAPRHQPHQGSRGQHGLAGAPEARSRSGEGRLCREARQSSAPVAGVPQRCRLVAHAARAGHRGRARRRLRRHRDGADRRSREAFRTVARRWRHDSHRPSLGWPSGFRPLRAGDGAGGNRRSHSAARQPAHLRPHEPAQLHAVRPGAARSRL